MSTYHKYDPDYQQKINEQEKRTREIALTVLKKNFISESVLKDTKIIIPEVQEAYDLLFEHKNMKMFVEVKERNCTSNQYDTDFFTTEKLYKLQNIINSEENRDFNCSIVYFALFNDSKALMYTYLKKVLPGKNSSISMIWDYKYTMRPWEGKVLKEMINLQKNSAIKYDY